MIRFFSTPSVRSRRCGLTSGYLHLQSGANESHERGGEVDGHVVVHRHVHQDQPLVAAVEALVSDKPGTSERQRRFYC